jgi:hypothetical protein
VGNLMKSPENFCDWPGAAMRHGQNHVEGPQHRQPRKDAANSQACLRNGAPLRRSSGAALLMTVPQFDGPTFEASLPLRGDEMSGLGSGKVRRQ